MSRMLLLSMSEGEAIAKCLDAKVGVSAIERLHSGGVRLVCMSTAGAQTMRKSLKKHLIDGEVIRERTRPRYSSW
jgi:hypothetical protein